MPCYQERDHGKCTREGCLYLHAKPHGPGVPATPNKKTRAPSPKGPKKGATSKPPCHFFARGICKNGKACLFDHSGTQKPRSDSPKGPPTKKKGGGKGRVAAAVVSGGGDQAEAARGNLVDALRVEVLGGVPRELTRLRTSIQG